jgi:hypothetical protein
VKGGHHFPRHIWDKSEEVWKKCWGKYWELERNIVQTHWEARKNEKKLSSPLHPKT